MIPVGFESTTPILGRAKIVGASDRAATVISLSAVQSDILQFTSRRYHCLRPYCVEY
jgi:hypothetical protein